MTRQQKLASHLYIHIPFCNHICTYCDFLRFVSSDSQKSYYTNNLIKEIQKLPNHHFKTIYIGGGTPNALNDKLLNDLLGSLKNKLSKNAEFTIECNPEFVTKKQAQIFKLNDINRISLGIQTTNNVLLKKLNRKHTIEDCHNAIEILQLNQIHNISADFIYGFNELTNLDLKNAFCFIKDNKLKHASFYSLEIKDQAILKSQNYRLNDHKIEEQLKLIEKEFKKLHWKRYEVSNWSINKKYQSKHNLAYWLSDDWIGLGLGAYGLEKKHYYTNIGNINQYEKIVQIYQPKDYYQHILMMGLRLINGINLKNSKFLKAYQFFQKDLNHKLLKIEKGFLKAKNINLLDNLLIDII